MPDRLSYLNQMNIADLKPTGSAVNIRALRNGRGRGHPVIRLVRSPVSIPPSLLSRRRVSALCLLAIMALLNSGPALRAAIPPTNSTPFTGTPVNIPGRIEPANFDDGGQNVAYFDTSAGNSGGVVQGDGRRSRGVVSRRDRCRLDRPGEWLRYSVNVQQPGTYTVRFNVACPAPGGTFHLEMNGTDVTGPLTIPNTGGWQAWQTVAATVALSQGPQQATLVVDADGANSFGNFGPSTSRRLEPRRRSPERRRRSRNDRGGEFRQRAGGIRVRRYVCG